MSQNASVHLIPGLPTQRGCRPGRARALFRWRKWPHLQSIPGRAATGAGFGGFSCSWWQRQIRWRCKVTILKSDLSCNRIDSRRCSTISERMHWNCCWQLCPRAEHWENPQASPSNGLLGTSAGEGAEADREWRVMEGHARCVTSFACTRDGGHMLS